MMLWATIVMWAAWPAAAQTDGRASRTADVPPIIVGPRTPNQLEPTHREALFGTTDASAFLTSLQEAHPQTPFMFFRHQNSVVAVSAQRTQVQYKRLGLYDVESGQHQLIPVRARGATGSILGELKRRNVVSAYRMALAIVQGQDDMLQVSGAAQAAQAQNALYDQGGGPVEGVVVAPNLVPITPILQVDLNLRGYQTPSPKDSSKQHGALRAIYLDIEHYMNTRHNFITHALAGFDIPAITNRMGFEFRFPSLDTMSGASLMRPTQQHLLAELMSHLGPSPLVEGGQWRAEIVDGAWIHIPGVEGGPVVEIRIDSRGALPRLVTNEATRTLFLPRGFHASIEEWAYIFGFLFRPASTRLRLNVEQMEGRFWTSFAVAVANQMANLERRLPDIRKETPLANAVQLLTDQVLRGLGLLPETTATPDLSIGRAATRHNPFYWRDLQIDPQRMMGNAGAMRAAVVAALRALGADTELASLIADRVDAASAAPIEKANAWVEEQSELPKQSTHPIAYAAMQSALRSVRLLLDRLRKRGALVTEREESVRRALMDYGVREPMLSRLLEGPLHYQIYDADPAK